MHILGLSWPGFKLLLHESVKNDDNINKLMALRSDLPKAIILSEVTRLSKSTIMGFSYWVNLSIYQAKKGEPMPWETIDHEKEKKALKIIMKNGVTSEKLISKSLDIYEQCAYI